jgi:hypothetical protein
MGRGQRLVREQGVPPEVSWLLSKPPKLRELRSALVELTENVSSPPYTPAASVSSSDYAAVRDYARVRGHLSTFFTLPGVTHAGVALHNCLIPSPVSQSAQNLLDIFRHTKKILASA